MIVVGYKKKWVFFVYSSFVMGGVERVILFVMDVIID